MNTTQEKGWKEFREEKGIKMETEKNSVEASGLPLSLKPFTAANLTWKQALQCDFCKYSAATAF